PPGLRRGRGDTPRATRPCVPERHRVAAATSSCGRLSLTEKHVISSPQSVRPGSIKTVIADCPAGTKAIAGGSGVSAGLLGGSGPSGNGTGWGISVVNRQQETINEVYALAVCASP